MVEVNPLQACHLKMQHAVHAHSEPHALLLQADYWRQMCGSDNPVIEYGNDVEGTAFCPPDAEDPLGSTSWNLQASPHAPWSFSPSPFA